MAQRTDLYSILVAYADKYNSPYIDIEVFLDFLGKYANKAAAEQSEWRKWVQDRQVKFWTEMSVLAEEGKCALLTDTNEGRIYMPHFHRDLIEASYEKADEEADIPFPNEESLGITLPENQIKFLGSENDLVSYLESEEKPEAAIIKINFTLGAGSALVPSALIPRRLTETAILKIRNYLRKYGNAEYALRKLSPQLQGRDSMLREQMNHILIRPLECYNAIESGGEFSFLFWAHLCSMVKTDIKKKKECLAEDTAALQSVLVIETVNGYYKQLEVKRKETDLAFKSLQSRLSNPPYLFDLPQILKFTNSKGVLLLSQYSNEDLEEWLKRKTTKTVDNLMPDLLVFQTDKTGHGFVMKDKAFVLCAKLLAEARPQIKDSLSKQWRKLLADYRSEPAMENDEDFEKALRVTAKKLCPKLMTLIEDPKLPIIYDEMENNPKNVPPSVRIFNKGQLLPYSYLFILKRKEMLHDAKLFLPFWYSLPFITAIIKFLKNLSRKKKAAKQAANEKLDGGLEILNEEENSSEINSVARELEFTLVPAEYNLDSYLEELETRWSRLIDRQARENLIEDVKNLVRDHLRYTLKMHKNIKITQETISQMAVNLVTRTPTLASLSGRDSLILYTELYIVKLLETIK